MYVRRGRVIIFTLHETLLRWRNRGGGGMRCAGCSARRREVRNAYTISAGAREGKRPLGKPRNNYMTIIFRNICVSP
jgi:hypothetical protein